MALKSFRDIVHELKMKRDKKLPNLKTPVKGPKGTSRFSRFKSASKSTTSSASLGTKNALSAGTEYPTEESVNEEHSKTNKASMTIKHGYDEGDGPDNKKFAKYINKNTGATVKHHKDGSTMSFHGSDHQIHKALQHYHSDDKKGLGDLNYHKQGKTHSDDHVDGQHTYKAEGTTFDEATWPDEMPNEDVDVDEELSISARRKLSRLMKRRKTQLKRSRLRARKRMAKTDVLKKRARRGARADAAKKLAKGKDKKDLSIAMKKSLEKRLAMPAVQRRIKTMTRRMMPTKRKLEISRKR